MQNTVRVETESRGPTPSMRSKAGRASKGLLRLFQWMPAPTPESSEQVRGSQDLAQLESENAGLRAELEDFRLEERSFGADQPLIPGSGLIAEIVPPIARSAVRNTVGSPSVAGYLYVADAWHCVLSRFLKDGSTVLDIGCGCGKEARGLVYHPYVKKYIGFDVIKLSIDWCNESILPRTGDRFEFHRIDVYSRGYNPQGKIKGAEVVFPAGDGTVNLAFASSLFTHLLEPDARRYLREAAPGSCPPGAFPADYSRQPGAGNRLLGR